MFFLSEYDSSLSCKARMFNTWGRPAGRPQGIPFFSYRKKATNAGDTSVFNMSRYRVGRTTGWGHRDIAVLLAASPVIPA